MNTRRPMPMPMLALSLLLSMTLVLAGSVVQAQQATPLQGGVSTYAAVAKPLDPLLWPGNNFDKDVARSLLHDPVQESSIWHRIPDWESGNWEGKQATNVRAIKYINGAPVECQPIGVHTAEGKFTKGLLRDKKGDIWHWYQSDYWTETDQGEQKVVSYILYSSPGQGEYPDFYAESVDFSVDKASNQIASLRRAKCWTRYINLGAGMFKEESLRTNYDINGNPTSTTINTALQKRTQAFSAYEASFASKKAIVSDFSNYLRTHGFANLVPAVK